MAGKEVAKTEEKNNAVAASSSFDYGDYAHAGFEGTTINDLSIPFINVLQSNSPEVEDQLIDGCKAGDLVNSVTKEILRQPVVVIPVHKEAAVIGWRPRNKGGGLAARYELDSDVFLAAIAKNGGSRIPPKDADGKRIAFKDSEGNDLVETYYVYCLILEEETMQTVGYCVLSFSSTKIKVHKDWMTAMYTQKGRPPIFANRCKISTTKQKNESGTYYNYKIGPMADTWRESLIPPNTPEGLRLLQEAKEFSEMISSGVAKADFDSIKPEHDITPQSDSDAKQKAHNKKMGNDTDEEIPF